MMRREKLWRHTGWRACLLLTLCSLLAVPAATWGRYDTLASGTDSARVARPGRCPHRYSGWRALIGQRSRHLCVCRFQHRGG